MTKKNTQAIAIIKSFQMRMPPSGPRNAPARNHDGFVSRPRPAHAAALGLRPPSPDFWAFRIDDQRLAEVLSPDARPVTLHGKALSIARVPSGSLHTKGCFGRTSPTAACSPGREGRVEVEIDPTFFMNGNALAADGTLVHCEHGRRCISRSEPEPSQRAPAHRYALSRPAVQFAPTTRCRARWCESGLPTPSSASSCPVRAASPSLSSIIAASIASILRPAPLRRMADFEQPNGLAFSPDGAHALCVRHLAIAWRSPRIRGWGATSDRVLSTSAKAAASPIAPSSAIPIMAIRTALQSIGADGSGPARPTEFTSGPQTGKLGFIPMSGGRVEPHVWRRGGRRLFIAATEACWRSTSVEPNSGFELMEVAVGSRRARRPRRSRRSG